MWDRIIPFLYDSFVLLKGPRSVRDINKMFVFPGDEFSSVFRPFPASMLLLFAYTGIPDTAATMGHFHRSLESNYSRSFPDRGGDAIYDFIRRGNNLSKPAPEGPNPELRGPGNDLVNRNAIMIS